MEKSTTQHLIISQMFDLSLKSEEIIEDYNLSLDSLNLYTLPTWEAKLRSFLNVTPLVEKLQTLVDEYRNLGLALGVNFYARPSLW